MAFPTSAATSTALRSTAAVLTSLTLPYRCSLIVLLFSLAIYFEADFAIAASTMGGGEHYPSLSQRRDTSSALQGQDQQQTYSGNPIFPGWYADPEAHIFEGQYWVYPSLSLAYDQQTYFDCFSSPDLATWTKHHRILDFAAIPWSTNRAAWAPALAFRGGAYYMYFSAGDGAGIGVAKSTTGPAGPFRDLLGRPLIAEVMFGAEPIDPAIFIDPDDDRIYLFYGGWSHGVVVELNDDMVSFKSEIKEITPSNYVEAPWMIKRNGVYYYMYSVGGWGDNSYGVEYVTSTTSPMGPFSNSSTKILSPDPAGVIAQGTGSHSVLHIPHTDDYYIVYHRRPIDDMASNDRYVCIDRMYFDSEGNIVPVRITKEGVRARPLVMDAVHPK